eukprot:EC795376.1.p1 GENE.EC795376.1~~EC795376.1.p1  ORF type:complete len:114 (-),score=10.43 EC795376.1:188-529(-)
MHSEATDGKQNDGVERENNSVNRCRSTAAAAGVGTATTSASTSRTQGPQFTDSGFVLMRSTAWPSHSEHAAKRITDSHYRTPRNHHHLRRDTPAQVATLTLLRLKPVQTHIGW